MASQQAPPAPVRPWFRLASMVRATPSVEPLQIQPQPPLAVGPRAPPPSIRPTLTVRPPSTAQPRPVAPPPPPPLPMSFSSIPQRSPPPSPLPPTFISSTPQRSPPPIIGQPPSSTVFPIPSPKPKTSPTVVTAPKGTSPPKIRPIANPPSPLSLPTALMKSSSAGEKGHKKPSKSKEVGMSVITIAGENRGAVMELSGNPIAALSSKDHKFESEETSNNLKPPPFTGFTNSNVQGVNNSILFNFTSTQHDPGVHISLSRKLNASGRRV